MVTFSLWIPPHSSVTVDDFSLKPTDDYYGWRPDAVEVFKQMAPKVVRFPGGCFASFYDCVKEWDLYRSGRLLILTSGVAKTRMM